MKMASAMQMPIMGPSAGIRTPVTVTPCGQPLNTANHSNTTPAGILSSGGVGMSNLTLGLPPSSTLPGGGFGAPANGLGETGLMRVKLADMLPEEGEPSPVYLKAVDAVSTSLARANAVIIELSSEDAKLVRCALQSAKLYLRNCVHTTTTTHAWGSSDWNKSTACRDSFVYKAGRSEEADPPPPCMPDVFRCMGKASRASLSVIARYLRLRGDVFFPLLDDSPLPPGDVSSSDLTASLHHSSPGACGKGSLAAGDNLQEVEKGLLMLIASDAPGLLVNDSNGHWYTADSALSPGDLLLLAGRALHQATAGLRRPSPYKMGMPALSPVPGATRTSLAFRLMPRHNATFDIAAALKSAGHCVPEGYGAITVAQFMDGLSAAETLMVNSGDSSLEGHEDSSLKLALSDPLSGQYLEDAMLNPKCGHSFGCVTLQRTRESGTCPSCSAAIDSQHLIPNIALRAAAAAFRREEQNRIQSRAKRRKENGHGETDVRRRENIGSPTEKESGKVTKGVQYPFKVNERVKIKGNKRTPEKFVGREAIITSQCLNGWYLVRTLDSNESVRLQYRSLQASGDNTITTNPTPITTTSNASTEEQAQHS
ncbi:hypothetical protein SELMODRAFT_272139 [Selaginella moellendorffii]|uniref:PUB 62/63 C-terminal domain-containing protein n=1 Tax=Selaginella moellendorffii TaxID=88036 RepID=D8T4J8_SELML|nr:uncharacterized protein LOC9631540 [Selaginella moellendorffii]EFJ08431.1 hypothetical protein SELMODRAFT_272139 [Selaginella moellendorffii]|eukprot:XP_024520119.1 uncharacterized protein LOC9631540 [Selaginella moellendorffii]